MIGKESDSHLETAKAGAECRQFTDELSLLIKRGRRVQLSPILSLALDFSFQAKDIRVYYYLRENDTHFFP